MRKIVRRNTPIPTRKVQNFTTAFDGQDSMVIRVFEGDRMMARDNLPLGEVELTCVSRAPRDAPNVEVSFEVDVCSPSREHVTSGMVKSLTNYARPTTSSKLLLGVSVSSNKTIDSDEWLTSMQTRTPKHQPYSYEQRQSLLKPLANSPHQNNTAIYSRVPYKEIERLIMEAEYCYPDNPQHRRVREGCPTNIIAGSRSKRPHLSTRRAWGATSRL